MQRLHQWSHHKGGAGKVMVGVSLQTGLRSDDRQGLHTGAMKQRPAEARAEQSRCLKSKIGGWFP